jgi:hypothetical protein
MSSRCKLHSANGVVMEFTTEADYNRHVYQTCHYYKSAPSTPIPAVSDSLTSQVGEILKGIENA